MKSLRQKAAMIGSIFVSLMILPILANNYISRQKLIDDYYQREQDTVIDSMNFFAVEALETGIEALFISKAEQTILKRSVTTIELRDNQNRTVYSAPEVPIYDGKIITLTISSRTGSRNDTDIIMEKVTV